MRHCVIADCQSNRLLILLERAETVNGKRHVKTKMNIDRHGPRQMPNNCQILDAPYSRYKLPLKNRSSRI